ncbi:MAG TPA: hypothetical protein ENN53_01235 [Candidatus Acetothermia bacterium]|nr:hypothetical protein [Candidatus Acetothermia bacterium]
MSKAPIPHANPISTPDTSPFCSGTSSCPNTTDTGIEAMRNVPARDRNRSDSAPSVRRNR